MGPIIPVIVGVAAIAALAVSKSKAQKSLPGGGGGGGVQPGGGGGGQPAGGGGGGGGGGQPAGGGGGQPAGGGGSVPQPIYPLAGPDTYGGQNTGRPRPNVMVVTGTMGPGNAPITIAKYGSGTENNYMQLGPLNPQFVIGVAGSPRLMGGFVGQAINVPWDWAGPLRSAGYDVRQDVGAGPQTSMRVMTAAKQAVWQATQGWRAPGYWEQ